MIDPHRMKGVLCVAAILLLAGCARAPEVVKEPSAQAPIQTLVEQAQAPRWITQKGAAFTEQRAVFYGVGNIAGLVNPSLRRRAAEAAARRDLAQEFRVYMAALQKQYLAETTGGSPDRHGVEQHIEDVMKQVTEQTLSGASIVEYWEHPSRNEAYALARLDLNGFLETVRRLRPAVGPFATLDSEVKEFSRDNGQELHDQLRHEQQRRTVKPAPSLSTPTPPSGPPSATPTKSADNTSPSSLPRPDPATFETGDIIWPRQPWIFIPYNSQPTGHFDPDKAGWEHEKQEFLERVKQNPRASEYDRAMAVELEAMTFEAFRARFLSGIEEDEVTAAGWLPWIGHVALIDIREGRPWVVESTFGGVRAVPYEEWLKERGKSLIWHGRVRGMDAAARARLSDEARKQIKKPYQFFNFDLLDDQGFYCSKFAWYLIRRSMGMAVDDNPEPRRKFWFSPKQLIRSPHIRLLTNPAAYAGKEDRVEPQSLPSPSRQSAEAAVIPSLTDQTCEITFSDCLSRCTGSDLESCTESCCCRLGGTHCPSALDCCPGSQ
jgi:cell wall-associated NlpC family hydrolase